MPLTPWTRYRKTRAQKKKALQMLALSGVIRPSTIELRYTTTRSGNFTEPSIEDLAQIELHAEEVVTLDLPRPSAKVTHLTRHLYSTAATFLAASKRRMQTLQWDSRNAA